MTQILLNIIQNYLAQKINSEEFIEKLNHYSNAQNDNKELKYDFEDNIFLYYIFCACGRYSKKTDKSSYSFNDQEHRTEIATLFGQVADKIPFRKDYFKPALIPTQISSEWKIIAPSPHIWTERQDRSLLSKYFPSENVDTLPDFNYNWFFATITLPNNKELAVMVNFVGTFETRKTIYHFDEKNHEYIYEKKASERKKMTIGLSFNKCSVKFSNQHIQLILPNKTLIGQEINKAYIYLEDYSDLPRNIYLLNSKKTLSNKNLHSYEHPFSTFYFRFSLRYKEYENTEFILDGLSYKGRALPPLQVRMNYLEPEKIIPHEKKALCEKWIYTFGPRKKHRIISSTLNVIEDYFYNKIDGIEFWDRYVDNYKYAPNTPQSRQFTYLDGGFMSSIFMSADRYNPSDKRKSYELDDKALRTEVAILFGQVSQQIHYRDDYFKPALIPTLLSFEWEILVPPTNIWTERQKRSLLPKYFPPEEVDTLPDFNYNWFFARLPLPDNSRLAVLINLTNTYETRRTIYHADEIEEYIYQKRLEENDPLILGISMNICDVDFINNKIQLILKDRVLIGEEITKHNNYILLQQALYHLNADETLTTKNMHSKRTDSYPFSTFYFKFPLTSQNSQEFENAEFVLDGLSYKRQALPPLRVKLNYVDYDKVKNYKAMPYVNLKEEHEITNY